MSDKEQKYPNENNPWPNHPGYGQPHHPQGYHHMPPPAGYYPPPPPGYHPPPPPGYYPPPPYYAHPAYQQEHSAPHQHHGKAHYEEPENDALYQQAQGVVEGLMGEQSGVFKDMLSKMGIDDKEFWKGAMIGAAAALILGNENVRNNLMQMFSGAGDMFKSGGEKVKDSAHKVKDGAYKASESVKQSVTTGNEIFKDTVSAGKQGFQESVERHKTTSELNSDEIEPEETLATESELTVGDDDNEK